MRDLVSVEGDSNSCRQTLRTNDGSAESILGETCWPSSVGVLIAALAFIGIIVKVYPFEVPGHRLRREVLLRVMSCIAAEPATEGFVLNQAEHVLRKGLGVAARRNQCVRLRAHQLIMSFVIRANNRLSRRHRFDDYIG